MARKTENRRHHRCLLPPTQAERQQERRLDLSQPSIHPLPHLRRRVGDVKKKARTEGREDDRKQTSNPAASVAYRRHAHALGAFRARARMVRQNAAHPPASSALGPVRRACPLHALFVLSARECACLRNATTRLRATEPAGMECRATALLVAPSRLGCHLHSRFHGKRQRCQSL